MERYFVTCLDDDGNRVFATHGWFLVKEAADGYAATIASDRAPDVVRQHSDFYQRFEGAHVYVVDNDFGIPVGYYSKRGLVRLLQEHSSNPAAVFFIADAME